MKCSAARERERERDIYIYIYIHIYTYICIHTVSIIQLLLGEVARSRITSTLTLVETDKRACYPLVASLLIPMNLQGAESVVFVWARLYEEVLSCILEP